MKKGLLITFLLGLYSIILWSQEIPIGTWRSHLNYSDSRILARYDQKIYVAAANGLYYYNTTDNSINKLTKNDGFGDVGISAMAVTPDEKKLIIGYSSGHVDILEDNELFAVTDIRDISILNDKSINEIFFYNDMAYLCTGFGLALLDYNQGMVKETYQNLGTGGTQLPAGSGTVLRDSIFLATPQGIIATAVASSNNLMDFNNWERLTDKSNYPETAVGLITTFKNRLYAHFSDSGLYVIDDNRWGKINFPENVVVRKFSVIANDLYVITGDQSGGRIYKLNEQNEAIQITANTVSSPSDILMLGGGMLWVADQQRGLVADILGAGTSIYPDGPATDNISKLIYFEKAIAGIETGLDADFSVKDLPGKLAIFQEGEWQNYTSANAPFLVGINDFTDLSYDPTTSNILISSFGAGVLGFDTERQEFNRPFDSQNPLFSTGNITALETGIDGQIWVSEFNSPDKLWGLMDGQWKNYPLGTSAHIKEIKAIPYQYVWLRAGKGLVVLDTESGNFQQLTGGNGNLIHDTVTTYAHDEYGYIWYGTPSGVAYLYDEGQIFEGGTTSVFPEYQNGNLFDYQNIDAIEIDAANRKWIATADGLWLFSEDGDSLIYHFTEENSPLVSNHITDIEINAASGEVFIATSKGLVSYRSNTSEGKSTHQQVKIFPNPVKSGFDGFIGISGVVNGAIVKITDLSGNLVREIHAQGGTATWDGNTLSGRRVMTGIYLVFSSSPDGKETFIGKLAFVN